LIAEIIPEWYDVEGRKVFRPDSRRKSGFKPTFPAGRFLSQPLKHWCTDLSDIRRFLAGCKYVSDEEQFGKRDYWQPPELFEESKKGDCEDFALWAWRQLLHMNYPARFALGSASRYGDGHAWVTFQRDGKTYLLEPLSWPVGLTLPRLSILKYKPRFSMSWDGSKVSYFEHADRKINWSLKGITVLVWEWLFFWVSFFLRVVLAATRRIARARARQTP
jgi:Bacterial transglutaminase-like cysteine proteinase BTLCP